jgi:hypothetical protein
MPYDLEQRICLLHVDETPGSKEITVHNKVVVRIVGVNPDALGKFSKERSELLPGLYAVDDNGVVYKKHWNTDRPESPTFGDLDIQWDQLTNSKGILGAWTPVEFWEFYNRRVSCSMGQGERSMLVDAFGARIGPHDGGDWGDLSYCEKHDHFTFKTDKCSVCDSEAVLRFGLLSFGQG